MKPAVFDVGLAAQDGVDTFLHHREFRGIKDSTEPEISALFE